MLGGTISVGLCTCQHPFGGFSSITKIEKRISFRLRLSSSYSLHDNFLFVPKSYQLYKNTSILSISSVKPWLISWGYCKVILIFCFLILTPSPQSNAHSIHTFHYSYPSLNPYVCLHFIKWNPITSFLSIISRFSLILILYSSFPTHQFHSCHSSYSSNSNLPR